MMTTHRNLSHAYRAAVDAQPVGVDHDRLARVLGGVGSRTQRDEDLAAALQDPAFVAALRIGAALQADAQALSDDIRQLRTPVVQRPLRRTLPFGWAVAASVALAALTGLALQPMRPQPAMAPFAQEPAADERDLISSVSFETSERAPQGRAPEGSIFVDRFDS